MKVGFIGTGTMGKPMAGNLLKKEYSLIVYARNPDKVQELIKQGARLVDSPLQVAKECPVIVLSLPFDPEVTEIITGNNGLLSSPNPGSLIIDTTTGTPENAIDMASKASLKGADYIDAPVSGGVQGAVNGTLTFITGGKEEAIEKATPVLKAMGSAIYRVGDVGAGRILKGLNQVISAMNTLTICETLVLGERLGITPNKFYEVLSHCSANSFHLQSKMPHFIIPEKFDKGHRIEMMIKDLEITLQMARNNNVPMQLSSLGMQMYRAGSAGGYAKKDISAMVKFLGSMLKDCEKN